ncbi:MAG: ABC-F family ATP-binding cassette domain-containing protein [Candidatus Dormibacteria bacterium]
MPLISCTEVGVAFGDRQIFSGLDLQVEPGDRLGVVGPNGEGKSSLLALLSGELAANQGRVERQRRLLVAHLPQESPPPAATTVLGEAMASRADLARLRDEMGSLERGMAAPGPDTQALLARYGECQTAYEGLGGYELESRARAVLGGLGLTEPDQARPPDQLSVGQVRRLDLAKLLLQQADLLLLDEPTNHLDLGAIEWLEAHLLQTAPTLCLVAHDRRLLERVCNRILELEAGLVEVYLGGYQSFHRQRRERRLRWRRAFEAQQAHISHQEDYIRRYKAGQRARQARGRQTLLDRLERVPEPPELRRMHLRLQAAPSARLALRTEALSCGRHGEPLLRVRDLEVARGERLAIVGPNGTGKTTLLHTLAGELEPVAGRVLPGARARIRLYRQDFADLEPERTVLESLLDDHPASPAERARTVLGAMLFSGERALARVGELSGGEKARVALARLGMDDANLLLLDEPTNHLDIASQEVLEEALRQYPGAVVLVSHDRAFVDAVATSVLEVHGDELVGRRTAAPPRLAPKRSRPAPPHRPPATAGARQLESEIQALERERLQLEERLGDPSTFSDSDHGRVEGERLAQVAQRLEAAYASWLELEASTER